MKLKYSTLFHLFNYTTYYYNELNVHETLQLLTYLQNWFDVGPDQPRCIYN